MSTETSDKNVAKIDDDINKLNKFCEYEDAVVLCEEALYEIQEAIERILSERGQDKARIKELEEANKIFALEGSKVRLSLYIKENYIPIQKIQDKIEELNNQEKELQNSITEEERETIKKAQGDKPAAIHQENWLVGGHGKKSAKECIKCGKCEQVCPQHIAIREELVKVDVALNS